MALKLDPRWPQVWRSPTSVQLGVDPARVVLHDVTDSEERMLAALAVGVSLPGLGLLCNGRIDERDNLLDRLAPVLLTLGEPSAEVRVAISGVGALAEELAQLLAAAGVRVVVADRPDDLDDSTPDLAIVTGHYVLPPSAHSLWLRRDVPHLPVVISDTAVTVGPMIEPGDGPCLLCLELHHRDADEAWPAVASQLLGRRSAAESALVAAEGASVAARAALARLLGEASVPVSVRIDAATGERSERAWFAHAECGCRGIAHLVGVGSATSRLTRTGSPGAGRPARVLQ